MGHPCKPRAGVTPPQPPFSFLCSGQYSRIVTNPGGAREQPAAPEGVREVCFSKARPNCLVDFRQNNIFIKFVIIRNVILNYVVLQ